ncbi:MAG TPA: c-type cytochrome [Acidobacteria bacterium]|nr:c-type cytochrome [Acidobacteriota bacterium]
MMRTERATRRALTAVVATMALMSGILVLDSWAAASGPPGDEVQAAPDGFVLDGDLALGKRIFKQYCQKCHGKKGNGQGIMAKDLDPKPRDFTDKERMSKRSDWQIYQGIKEGGSAVGLSDKMAPWGDTLEDDEILAVGAYIRQFAK